MKIGIPRALLYYWYGFTWRTFWEEAGAEVVVSGPTERSTVAIGSKAGVDELCLPIKIFLGHVRQIADQADWIMIPHLIKVETGAYLCPKFMGLPDLVYHALPDVRDKVCVVTVGPRNIDMLQSLKGAALKVGIPERQIPKTLDVNNRLPALYELAKSGYPRQSDLKKGRLRIGILGHPYCIYDRCFNLNVFDKLNGLDVDIFTPEMMPENMIGVGSGRLHKELFWSLGRFQFDALEWMIGKLKVDGFIHLSPFACGPEAIIGDMLERRIKQAGLPVLKLLFEEHSGEAGMVTRLEAFIDLIHYRSRVC